MIAAGLCLATGDPVRAEVSADPLPHHRVRTLLMDWVRTSITDGADPIPSISWQTFRELPAGRQLNRGGAFRPDGRPDVIFHRQTAVPIVVWAYNNGGGEHDIAFSVWEGRQWGATRFLTHSSEANDLDPRIFISPTGTIHVVWTTESLLDGAPDRRVMLATRTPGVIGVDGDVVVEPSWSGPTRVTPPNEFALRPTVAEHAGQLWIAYERIHADGVAAPSELVLIRRSLHDENFAVFEPALVLDANRLGPLDPLLTLMNGRLWLDWQHGPDYFAFTVLRPTDLSWTAPHPVPWPNPSWLGKEDVRQTIRRRVLSSNAAAVEPADTAN